MLTIKGANNRRSAMLRLIAVFAGLVSVAPALAGVSIQYTEDQFGNVSYTRVTTPDFVYIPPRDPVFTSTRFVSRRDNGNKVIVTTTYRNGMFWSKERAVIQANRSKRDDGREGKGGGHGR